MTSNTYPSLLSPLVQHVWCPVPGIGEEDDLVAEELALEKILLQTKEQHAPKPIGVLSDRQEDEEDEDAKEDHKDAEEDDINERFEEEEEGAPEAPAAPEAANQSDAEEDAGEE